MDPPSSSNPPSKKRGRGRPSVRNLGVSKGKGKPLNKTIQKRKLGLTKKLSELTILCGAEACFIYIEPSDCNSASEEGINNGMIEVWPDMEKAREIVDKYRGMSTKDQNKNKTDCSTHLIQSMNKLKQELAIKRKENMDLQMQLMSPQSLDMLISKIPAKNIETLIRHIDNKLDAVNGRIQFLAIQNLAHRFGNNHESASLCFNSGYIGRDNGGGGNTELETADISQMLYPTQMQLRQQHQSINSQYNLQSEVSMVNNPNNGLPFSATEQFYAPSRQPQMMHGGGNMNYNWGGDQLNCDPHPWLVDQLPELFETTQSMDIRAVDNVHSMMTCNSSLSLTEDAHFHNLLPSY